MPYSARSTTLSKPRTSAPNCAELTDGYAPRNNPHPLIAPISAQVTMLLLPATDIVRDID